MVPYPHHPHRPYGQIGGRIPADWLKTWATDADAGELHNATGLPLERWQTFIDDARRFAADGWLDKAIALGWLDMELFAADPVTPFGNSDPARSGLLVALNGRVVTGLTADYAVIKGVGDEAAQLHNRQLQMISKNLRQRPLVNIFEWKPLTAKPKVERDAGDARSWADITAEDDLARAADRAAEAVYRARLLANERKSEEESLHG
jgi:hypothetical protein